MEIKKRNLVILVLFLLLNLFVINLSFASSEDRNECYIDKDCDDGVSITIDRCVFKDNIGANVCEFYGFANNLKCTSDLQCDDFNSGTRDYCGDNGNGEKSCFYKIKNQDSFGSICRLGVEFYSKNYSVISYKNIDSCEYKLIKKDDVCDINSDCDDGLNSTADVCEKLNFGGNMQIIGKLVDAYGICRHYNIGKSIQCTTDLDCKGFTLDPYDYEYCSGNYYDDYRTCDNINESSFNYQKIYYGIDDNFFSFLGVSNLKLNYIPKINFLGHLNNGNVEKFNIDVKTGKVKSGYNPDSFILVEFYQNTFDTLRYDNYKYYEEHKYDLEKKGFFNKERYFFVQLLSNYFLQDRRYKNSNLNVCKVVKLNDGKWNELFAKFAQIDGDKFDINANLNQQNANYDNVSIVSSN